MFSEIAAVLVNITLTCILACGAFCAAILYFREKLSGFIALIAIFVSYLIDNTIVFCTEILPRFAESYDRMFLESPSPKTVCFIIRISCLLYLMHKAMPAFRMNAVITLAAIHGSLLICVPIISNNDWMMYFYYFPSQFVVICVCIWGLCRYDRQTREGTAEYSSGLKKLLLYFLVMSLLVLVEDTFVIFFVDVYSGPGLKILNRNFSENLMFAGFALSIIDHCVKNLKEFFSKPHGEPAPAEKAPVTQMDPVRQFSLEYGLTDRELEILRCVLQEMSQQQISDTLVIALGTVKTHTHNIYRKTNTSNRNQIIVQYQEFCDQLASGAIKAKMDPISQ